MTNDAYYDAVRQRALHGLAHERALGSHFPGQLLAARTEWTDDGLRMEVDDLTADDQPAEVSPVALGVIGDMAIGSAVRRNMPPGTRTATVTLTVSYVPRRFAGVLSAESRLTLLHQGQGLGSTVLRAGDEVVGHSAAWFATPPVTGGRQLAPLPWQAPPVPQLTEPELSDGERTVMDCCLAAARRAEAAGLGLSWSLMDWTWQEAGDGLIAGSCPIEPQMRNRARHVQGGLLYAAAAMAAIRSAGFGRHDIVDGTYQFLRPADGERLQIEARRLRRGRGTASVEIRLTADGTHCGEAIFGIGGAD